MRLVLGDQDLVLGVGRGGRVRHPGAALVRQHRRGLGRGAEHLRPARRADARPRRHRTRTAADRAEPSACWRPSSSRPGSTRALVTAAAADATRLERRRRCRRLLLVSAPAGFGKSDAAGAWLLLDGPSRRPRPWPGCPWTQGDNDPVDLLDVRRRRAATGRARRRRDRARPPASARRPPIDGGADHAAQRPRRRRRPGLLVLDDYHLIDAPDVHEAMAFLLDHLPPQLHLVIASRADPPLPLARLRARGELVEVRAADLRFTDRRGRGLPQRAMGLRPRRRRRGRAGGPDRGLDRRPPAGRPVAAGPRRRRRLHRRASPGDDRYVVDYLVEEVLQRQPEDVRDFLLRDLGPGPADRPAVRCGHRPGRRPGDARGARPGQPVPGRRSTTAAGGTATTTCSPTCCRPASSTSSPSGCPTLHRRASDWYEQNGDPTAAIEHALAAGDFDRAAGLWSCAIPALRRGPARGPAARAGWRRSPTRSFAAGPCSATATSAP